MVSIWFHLLTKLSDSKHEKWKNGQKWPLSLKVTEDKEKVSRTVKNYALPPKLCKRKKIDIGKLSAISYSEVKKRKLYSRATYLKYMKHFTLSMYFYFNLLYQKFPFYQKLKTATPFAYIRNHSNLTSGFAKKRDW